MIVAMSDWDQTHSIEDYIGYPSGVDLGPVVGLRIASAATLFFGVFSLGFTQWAGLRVRALLAAP